MRKTRVPPTDIWRRSRDLNPGYIDGRRVSPPLHHPCSLRPLIRTILYVTKVFPVKVIKNEVSSHNNSENATPFLLLFCFVFLQEKVELSWFTNSSQLISFPESRLTSLRHFENRCLINPIRSQYLNQVLFLIYSSITEERDIESDSELNVEMIKF